jgi:hypothetical protein
MPFRGPISTFNTKLSVHLIQNYQVRVIEGGFRRLKYALSVVGLYVHTFVYTYIHTYTKEIYKHI